MTPPGDTEHGVPEGVPPAIMSDEDAIEPQPEPEDPGRTVGVSELPRRVAVFIVRHGESEWNQARAENNFFAMAKSYDHPLNGAGLQQAKTLAENWASSEIASAMNRARVYSSPLTRAAQTAMMGFAAHPRVLEEGIYLLRSAREVKHSVLNLDSVGIAVGEGVHERACEEAAKHLAPEDLQTMRQTKLQAAEAREKWWTSNYDSAEEIHHRVADLFASIRRDVAEDFPCGSEQPGVAAATDGHDGIDAIPCAIVVSHSLYIREVIQCCTMGGTPFAGTDVAAELAAGKLCNAGTIQLIVQFPPENPPVASATAVQAPRVGCYIERARLLFGSTVVGGERAVARSGWRLHSDLITRHGAARSAPTWIADDDASACMLCGTEFGGALSLGNRRHHCRYCGWVVCVECLPVPQTLDVDRYLSSEEGHRLETVPMGGTRPIRVCNSCMHHAPAEVHARRQLQAEGKVEFEFWLASIGTLDQKISVVCFGADRATADAAWLKCNSTDGHVLFRYDFVQPDDADDATDTTAAAASVASESEGGQSVPPQAITADAVVAGDLVCRTPERSPAKGSVGGSSTRPRRGLWCDEPRLSVLQHYVGLESIMQLLKRRVLAEMAWRSECEQRLFEGGAWDAPVTRLLADPSPSLLDLGVDYTASLLGVSESAAKQPADGDSASEAYRSAALEQLLNDAGADSSRWGDALVGHLLYVEGFGEGVVLAFHSVVGATASPPPSISATAHGQDGGGSSGAAAESAEDAAGNAVSGGSGGASGMSTDGLHTIEFSAADDADRADERTVEIVHLRRCFPAAHHWRLQQEREGVDPHSAVDALFRPSDNNEWQGEGRRWLIKLPEPRLAIGLLGHRGSPTAAGSASDISTSAAVRDEGTEGDGDGGGGMEQEAPTAAAAAATAAAARTHLEALYSLHNPRKLADVDKLLAEWAGKEHQLLANVERRYGGLPTADSRVAV